MSDFATFAARRHWAMDPHHLRAWVRLAKGITLTRDELRAIAEENQAVQARAQDRSAASGGAVMVIPALGVLSQRGGMSTTSTEELAGAVKAAAADSGVKAIVLEFDSPGGEVYGLDEAAAEIRAARGSKPIVSSVNSLAASAAYYLASQATEVMATPGGELGSVGVFGVHEDWSRAMDQAGVTLTLVSAGEGKTGGNPYEPLSEPARGDMQASVDRYYGLFVAAVSTGRGVSRDMVRDDWKAKMYGAKQAVEIRMADSVGTLADAIRRAAYLARTKGAGPVAEVERERIRLDLMRS